MKISSNATLILIERALRVISSVASFYFLSLFFSSDHFGYYAFVLAVSYSFSLLSYLGFDQLYPKYFAEKTLSLTNSLLFKFFVSLLFSLVFLLLFVGYNKVDVAYVGALTISILLNNNSLIFSYYNSASKVSTLVLNTFISFFISLVLKIYAVEQENVYILYSSFVFEFFIGLIIFSIKECNLRELFSLLRIREGLEFVKINFKSIFYVFLSVLIIQINIRVDSFFISIYRSGVELSNYSLAIKINEVFAVVVSSFIATYLPRIYSSSNSFNAFLVVKKVIIIILLLTFFVSFLSYCFADYFITLFFDENYSLVASILSILVFCTCFGGISSVFGAFLIYQNKEKSRLLRVFLVTLTNIVLCYLLVMIYGVYGAALAGMISSFIFGIFYNIVRKELHTENYK